MNAASPFRDALIEIQDRAGHGIPGREFRDWQAFWKVEASGEFVRGLLVGFGGVKLGLPQRFDDAEFFRLRRAGQGDAEGVSQA